jgi:uncharacterized membrane protein
MLLISLVPHFESRFNWSLSNLVSFLRVNLIALESIEMIIKFKISLNLKE